MRATGCSQIVLIGLDGYRQLKSGGRHYLTAPDHNLEGETVEAKHDVYWPQRR